MNNNACIVCVNERGRLEAEPFSMNPLLFKTESCDLVDDIFHHLIGAANKNCRHIPAA